MRPIKFRAWDKKTGKMIDLNTCKYFFRKLGQDGFEIGKWEQGEVRTAEMEKTGFDAVSYIGDSMTMELMQFTGLLDKNGKEIYEGDILKSFDPIKLESRSKDYEYQDVVVWDEKGAYFRLQKFWHLMSHVEAPEVIGNIYENPELLK